eukprot:g15932.t1
MGLLQLACIGLLAIFAQARELQDCSAVASPDTVRSTEDASNLAASLQCSNGDFDVRWVGEVIVAETIHITDGTSLNITGAGSESIAGGGYTTQLFYVDGGSSLHLSDMTLANGNAPGSSGGAIFLSESSASFSGSTSFISNSAGEGGAIYASYSTVSWDAAGTLFTSNSAEEDGGAICAHDSTVSWDGAGTQFISNSAGDEGGAISADDSTVSWDGEGTQFISNSAGDDGGAIMADGSAVSWDSDGTLFNSNTAAKGGGAIYTRLSTVVWHGHDTQFSNNSAFEEGGAISAYYRSTVSWDGDGTLFTSNHAVLGGAVGSSVGSNVSWDCDGTQFSNNAADLDGGALHVVRSIVSWGGNGTRFTSNSAGDNGGAISAEDSTVAWHGDSTQFISNKAGGHGGAIDAWDDTIVFWDGDGTQFRKNSAKERGGAIYGYANANVSWDSGTLFSSNDAGDGGVICASLESTVSWDGDGTLFTSNNAAKDGGAIYVVDSSKFSWKGNPTFSYNVAGANGGALAMVDIHHERQPEALTAATFIENRAGYGGGALYMLDYESPLNFTDVTFQSNFASGAGGAVTVQFAGDGSSPVAFSRCTFSQNVAGNSGGAVEVLAGHQEFDSCHFEDNSADIGGAMILAGNLTVVRECSFFSNSVSSRGLAVAVGGSVDNIGSADISGSTFDGNELYCASGLLYRENTEEGGPNKRFEAVCFDCPDWIECSGCTITRGEVKPVCEEPLEHTTAVGPGVTLETLTIAGGYWRATKESEIILACYNEGACVGGQTGAEGYCSPGYKGPYCAVCENGYSSSPAYTCTRCSSSRRQGLMAATVIGALISVLAVVYFCRYVLSTELGGEDLGCFHRQVFQAVPLQALKIVVVVWQILTQFTEVANVTYPGVYQDFISTINIINFDPGSLLAAGCLWSDIDFHGRLLLTITMLIAFFFFGVFEVLSPYKSEPDMWLSRGGHALVFLTMFYMLLLKVDVSGERDESQAAFAGLFVLGHALMILAVVVEVVAIFYASRNDQKDGGKPVLSESVPGRQHLNMNMNNPAEAEVSEKVRQANLKMHNEVWDSRRSMAQATLSAAKALRRARELLAGQEDPSKDNKLAEDGKGSLVISAIALAVAAATVRLGGRAALISALGLDFGEDTGMKENVESFLVSFDGLGPIRYGYFLGGWIVAKTLCVDFLSIVLALGSGVVFGGVLQGALVSTACATIASGLGFQLARTKLRTQVEGQLEKRPALRALEKVVSEEGFKTVVTLRLAPVLPIPLGAYNYVYGTTSLKLPVFLSGMFVGSIKPYLLDSYLGVFGKQMVDGEGGLGGDLALVGTFFVVVLVGTFASQVASRTWEELNAEAKKSVPAGEPAADGDAPSASPDLDDGLDWLELWGVERSSLPEWFSSWKTEEDAVRNKIRGVVKEEWAYLQDREALVEERRGNGLPAGEDSTKSGLPPPGPPLLDKSGRFFDLGAYVSESTVFPFVLIESFWKYSDPKLVDSETGGREEGADEQRDVCVMRSATPGQRMRGARSGQQRQHFSQTNQAAHELNKKLRAENATLRNQNVALARELNAVKEKLKKTSLEKLEIARRVIETRASETAKGASPATPHAFSFSASGRGHTKGGGSDLAETAAEAYQQATRTRGQAQGSSDACVGATVDLPSLSAGGLRGPSVDTKTPPAAVCPSPGILSSLTPDGGNGEGDGNPRSAEAVRRIEGQSQVYGRRGRRSSILPNTLKDLGCGDRLRTPGRLILGMGEENENPSQKGDLKTPPAPSSRAQPHLPLSIRGGAVSRSLDPPSDGNSSGDSRRSSTSRSLELSSSAEDSKGGGVSRSLDLMAGGDGGGSPRPLELLEAGGDSGSGKEGGLLPENAVVRMEPLPGTRDDEWSRSSTGAMAASSAPSHPWSSSSYTPGLLVLNHPADNDNDNEDDLGDVAHRRPSRRRWLEQGDMAWTASEQAGLSGQVRLSGAAEAVSVERTGRESAAGVAAARWAPGREFFPPSGAREASSARPSARSRPLVSTPMPAMGQAPPSSRRPRRDVARPVSYEEPSLNMKMRQGHVMFLKTRLPLTGNLPETGSADGHGARPEEEEHGR